MAPKRAVVVGALALVAAGFSALAMFGTPDSGPVAVAQCLTAFGSLNNGVCLDAPSDAGGSPSAGIPPVGIGPSANGIGPGISTGPLFPGQTFNLPVAP
jgi:hypothetical protein